ncbi:MAG: hypothetical protein ABH971_00775 [bacterium]
MNPEEKELLEKTYEMTKENSHILKGIKKANQWSALFRIFYWIIIIGISIGIYYYIEPYINSILKSFNNLQATFL